MRSHVQRQVLVLARSQFDALELHEFAHGLLDARRQPAGWAGVNLRDIVCRVELTAGEVVPPGPGSGR